MTNSSMPVWASVRCGAHRGARWSVAAEGGGGYDPAGQVPPFGLPVLAGVPELAEVLEAVAAAERRLLEAVVVVSRGASPRRT